MAMSKRDFVALADQIRFMNKANHSTFEVTDSGDPKTGRFQIWTIATHPDDTTRAASEFVCSCHSREMAEKIAASLNGEFNQYHLSALAQFCRERNPRFMRQRWLDYIAGECGPNGGEIKPERCWLQTGHAGPHLYAPKKTKRLLGECAATK